jgi:hypothetical protein
MKTAALIRDGVVVNAAVYDEDTSADWLAAVSPEYDEVRIVDEAGVGWTVEAEGLRMPAPFPSWVWSGSEWEAPMPKPDGEFVWDEAAGVWVAA